MESRWITGLIILIIITFIVLCIFNAVTYGKIANENKTVGDVTPDGARTLQVLNIIFTIMLFFALFWYCYKFYYNSSELRAANMEAAKLYAARKYQQYQNYRSQSPLRTAAVQGLPNPIGENGLPMNGAQGSRIEGEINTKVQKVIEKAYDNIVSACMNLPGASNLPQCMKVL